MVGVAQLVELRIVIPAVVGSSPIVHPSFVCESQGFRKIRVLLQADPEGNRRAISSIGRAVDS